MNSANLLIKILFSVLLLIRASASFGVTSLDNAQEGYGLVQVKGAMWGSGLLMLLKDKETKDGAFSGFTLSVLTPSHLIQNSTHPTIQIPRRIGNFLTGSVQDSKSFTPKFMELVSQGFPTTIQFQDALRDIAVLKINIPITDPIYVTLFDIARRNLVFCEDEDADSLCFRDDEFNSKLKRKMIFNEKINWILNDELVRQPLNKENTEHRFSLVDDQYISGLFKKIFEISVYGGPGMSGGGFYVNDMLAGMVSKVHYDGFPEVYAIPMNEIYKTISCSYWKTEECENEPLVSNWITVGKQQFLSVNYKGFQLKQIVAPTPYGFAGGPGVIGSGGGPGVIGSGGNGTTNPYIYIHHLPGAELMETTGIPLVNPFSLSENNFILNNEKYCGLQTNGTMSEISPSISRIILMNKDNDEVHLIPCLKQEKPDLTKQFLAPKKARYFVLNRHLSSNSSQHYDFMEHATLDSFTQLQKSSDDKTFNEFAPPKPEFLDSYRFTLNNKGCMNTFPISLCYQAKQDQNSVFKANFNYLTDREQPYSRSTMDINVLKNFESISLTKLLQNGEPEKSTVLKKQRVTQNSIFFANETNTTRAVLNFSDQNKLQPFNLFIQTPNLLLQFEW